MVVPPVIKMINTSKIILNLLQNLGFFQGLKLFKKQRNLDKRTPTVDFRRCSVLDFSN